MIPKYFINQLIKNNWNFKPNETPLKIEEVAHFAEGRLINIDDDLFRFLNSFDLLSNVDDDIWFIPLKDYESSKSNDEGFNWNDFEMESLEYADDDSQKNDIKLFWNTHFPFLFSVRNEYSYFAIVIKGKDKGKIVLGREPEYEEAKIVADSLSDFFEKFLNCIIKTPSVNFFDAFN